MASGPIIVTALFAPADFAWFDRLRSLHYPKGRTLVPAHLALFRHLPPSIEEELDRRLRAESRAACAPQARIAGVTQQGQSVAFRLESRELDEIRARIAEAFAPMLIPQDAAPSDLHVTIQNKVSPTVAAELGARLAAQLQPRAIVIPGLASWRYLDGPWEAIARYAFSRSGRCRRN